MAQIQQGAPQFIADILVMFLTDMSLKSTFLNKESMKLFEELKDVPSDHNIYKMLMLLSSSRKFLEESEISRKVNLIMESIKKESLSVEDEGAFVLLLKTIKEVDKSTLKSINRKLKKLEDKHPAILREIRPKKRPGFR